MAKPEGTALVRGLDAWQRRTRWAGVAYAVAKKSRDDNVNLLAVALAWYGFTSLPGGGEPTAADERVLGLLARQEQRSRDEAIGVGFASDPVDQAGSDPTHGPAAQLPLSPTTRAPTNADRGCPRR